MLGARRVNLSAALFVVICFFLPWAHAGSGQTRDSISGFEIARDSRPLLWLIPFAMLAVLLTGLARSIWDRIPSVYALTGTVGGGLSAFLMYCERSAQSDGPLLLPLEWTFWYWLGFASSIIVLVAAFIFYIKRTGSP